MNVLLVQGTWGDTQTWWKRGSGGFADAVVAAGHTLIDTPRPFEWSTGLGGVELFTERDLTGWKGGGRHLHDYADWYTCRSGGQKIDAIIAHSHGRQVVRYALQWGLTVPLVILVSGPIRQDVNTETPNAYDPTRVQRVVCLHGGEGDKFQWYGELGDGHLGIVRDDPSPRAENKGYPDADHSSMLYTPAQFGRVIGELHL